MSILTSASGASVWRGYEYYTMKRVVSLENVGEDEYEGQVAGRGEEPYHVKINTAHIRRSRCNCPHADGTQKICKHMVALYFAAYPKEAEKYIAEVEEYEREEQKCLEEHCAEVRSYVNSLSKKELQEELYQALIEIEEMKNRYW